MYLNPKQYHRLISVLRPSFRNYIYIRSAFRVSDDEIRLSIVKSHENKNLLYFAYGNKSGIVHHEYHLPDFRDIYSPPCEINGYIGYINGLTSSDNASFIELTSFSGVITNVAITDVRPSATAEYKHQLGVCLQPIYLMTDYSLFIQFFEYWLSEGATKFYIYWESFTHEIRDIIDFYKSNSNADIELVEWSKLPRFSYTEESRYLNPNSYWFNFEDFLSVFDCMHRARYNVKYVGQSGLTEMFHIQNMSLVDYLEKMSKQFPELVDIQFQSQNVNLTDENFFEASRISDFSFKPFERVSVNHEIVEKPMYVKMIQRPERGGHIQIHKPNRPELIPGRKFSQYEHIDADPKIATVWHFRRVNDTYRSYDEFISTDLATNARKWEKNFRFRISMSNLDINKRITQEFSAYKLYISSSKKSSLDRRFSEVHPTTIELYQSQSQLRKEKLKNLNNNSWLILYSVLVPEVFCKDLVRIGTVGDGGKWVCNPIRMRNFETCTVYSLGINNEPSFEESFANFTHQNCFIRSFDKDNQISKTVKRIENSNGIFMKALISSETDKSIDRYSLKSLMEIFNDKRIDILKIDIEGFEYQITDELTSTPICQILIEIHGATPTRTFELLYKISQSGYYLFSYEINGAHHALSEYSFIHESCLEDYGVNTVFGKYLS